MGSTPRYTKKPITIEAIEWTGSTHYWIAIRNFCNGFAVLCPDQEGDIIITTLEGDMRANKGDYIIKGIKGEFYPCKPDIFEMSYDKA